VEGSNLGNERTTKFDIKDRPFTSIVYFRKLQGKTLDSNSREFSRSLRTRVQFRAAFSQVSSGAGCCTRRGDIVTIASRDQSQSFVRQEIERWFHELRDPMFGYLRSAGCEQWIAEEIVQETFVRLLAARQQGVRIHDVRAWVFRVARNQWIDIRRETRRYWADGVPPELTTGPSSDPEQRMIRRERSRRVREQLAQLPELQRECVRLKAQGLRYREIAAKLGISMTSAVEHVRRAIAQMRKLLRTDT
jgi:RNA polymerase sigma-70 factor (ECF subfamily)